MSIFFWKKKKSETEPEIAAETTEAPVEEVVPADTTAQDSAAQAAPAEAAAPADSANTAA